MLRVRKLSVLKNGSGAFSRLFARLRGRDLNVGKKIVSFERRGTIVHFAASRKIPEEAINVGSTG
jgi:hypothetical protein